MDGENITSVSEFILLGLTNSTAVEVALFVIFLPVYVVALSGNLIIIILITTNTRLQKPMYYFLINLSMVDIILSSSNVPSFFNHLLSSKKTISFTECALQMYISLTMGITECVLFAVMAYDRYIAICQPLHYNTIMTRTLCVRAALGTWTFGCVMSVFQITTTILVPICGNNVINHFVCEGPAYLSLRCTDTFINDLITLTLCVIIAMIPACFISISYIRIIRTILKMTSSASRRKTFSTCSSHLIVVTLYFGPILVMYMKPQSYHSSNRDKILSVFYIIITPMLNPLIYTLRNKEVYSAMRKTLKKNLLFRKN